MTENLLWSFRYESGGPLCSLGVLAPTKEAAESALFNAVCEGAIALSPSSAYASRQSHGEVGKT